MICVIYEVRIVNGSIIYLILNILIIEILKYLDEKNRWDLGVSICSFFGKLFVIKVNFV